MFDNCKLSMLTRIAADNSNNLYIGGSFSGAVTINSKEYKSEDGRHFLCKTDASGNILWVVQSSAVVYDILFRNPDILVLLPYDVSANIMGQTVSSAKDNFCLLSISSEGTKNWIFAPEYNSDNVHATAVKTDAEGNIYILGEFANSVAFGTKSLSKIDERNAYLVKLNKSGSVQWLSQMTGGNSFITGIWTQSMTYSDSNHIYVTGTIAGNCTFGSNKISTKQYYFSNGGIYARAVFVATYNSRGICSDVKIFITEADVADINVDKSGNIVLAGHFKGAVGDVDFATSYFGETAVKATIDPIAGGGPSEDSYVAKFTPEGKSIWTVRSTGSSTDRAMSLASAPDGSVYISGFSFRNMGFSSNNKKIENMVNTGNSDKERADGDFYILKVSSDGNIDWFKYGGGAGSDRANDMIVSSNTLYVCGFMSGNVVFDKVSKNLNNTLYNAVLIKL